MQNLNAKSHGIFSTTWFYVLASGYLTLLSNSHLIEEDVFSISPFCGKILQNSLYKHLENKISLKFKWLLGKMSLL